MDPFRDQVAVASLMKRFNTLCIISELLSLKKSYFHGID